MKISFSLEISTNQRVFVTISSTYNTYGTKSIFFFLCEDKSKLQPGVYEFIRQPSFDLKVVY